MSAPLFETLGNIIPKGLKAYYMTSSEGYVTRYAVLPSGKTSAKGTVIILNGRNECIEKYFEIIGDLHERSFSVATFDWIGQGGSSRLVADTSKGYVKSFDLYIDQLEQFFAQVILPDFKGPFYILAHSTGALTAIYGSCALRNKVERMVLCAPLLGLINQPLRHSNIARLSRVLNFLGFGKQYMGGGPRPRETLPFENNKLTRDETRYRRNCKLYKDHPELALGSPTIGWVNAVCRSIKQVQSANFKSKVIIPTLIIAAGNDKIVDNRSIETYIKGARSTALVTIDGAEHELLQEKNLYRDQVLAAFDAFIPGTEKIVI
jgi:lysophospholipase